MRLFLAPVVLAFAAATAGADPEHAMILASDTFDTDLSRWVVEQRPGGTVTLEAGTLVIRDQGGCTMWYREPFDAPVEITYTVVVSSASRVSDMNCFWMASDPASPRDLFAAHSRTGAFADYDGLRTYYVGHGGNHNSSTRFRRYLGNGERPLLPEHDLAGPPFLLEADRPYRIRLVADGRRAEYHVDGKLIFTHEDPEPLIRGWFGFRTVWSELRISDFAVRRLPQPVKERPDARPSSG